LTVEDLALVVVCSPYFNSVRVN